MNNPNKLKATSQIKKLKSSLRNFWFDPTKFTNCLFTLNFRNHLGTDDPQQGDISWRLCGQAQDSAKHILLECEALNLIKYSQNTFEYYLKVTIIWVFIDILLWYSSFVCYCLVLNLSMLSKMFCLINQKYINLAFFFHCYFNFMVYISLYKFFFY